MAGFDRNGWPTSVGISGRIASESVAALRRITHPFRFHGPGNPDAIVHDIDLCERIGVLHERRKMSAASDQPGQIEDILAPVWSAPLTVDRLQVGN